MFNPFKKQKTSSAKSEKPAELKSSEPKPAAESKAEPARPKGERRISGVLISPHLTEKTTAASSKNWYTFRIQPDANRIMVKRAVEDRHGVRVEKVRMLRKMPKKIRLGGIAGKSPGFKKAMVKVKAGQTIEFT